MPKICDQRLINSVNLYVKICNGKICNFVNFKKCKYRGINVIIQVKKRQ